jgi:hypothetical protein
VKLASTSMVDLWRLAFGRTQHDGGGVSQLIRWSVGPRGEDPGCYPPGHGPSFAERAHSRGPSRPSADASIDDAIERLVFLARIEEGLAELDAGQGVPHEEVKQRFGA